MRTAESHKIGAARGENSVDLIGRRDVADAHGCDARFVADLFGERGLEHASINWLGIAHRLAGGYIDQIDSGLREGARDRHCVVARNTTFGPIGGRDAYRHRLVRRPRRPQCFEYLKWEPEPVSQRAAISVRA